MTTQTLTAFTQHQPRLFGIAYRMLGSVADAEDMVQETFLRWQKGERGKIKSAEAWLTTVVTRLCLNHLKLARVQREEYIGPWLPEPIVADSAADPRENAEQTESLALAFLVILETLTPTERAVYLLREVFDCEFPEVAHIVKKSDANCRQLLRRARQRVAKRRPRFKPPVEQQQRLADAFLVAAQRRDVAGLMAILAEDVVFVSDGGAGTPTLRRPIVGSEPVTRLLTHGARREQEALTVTRPMFINGRPGFVAYRGATPRSAGCFDFEGERIRAIYLVANPAKLRGIPRVVPPPAGPLASKN